MPLYVTVQIVKKLAARTSGEPAYEVKMIGDGKPEIKVNYYVKQHPQAYAGMEHLYLTNPVVKFLSGEPPVIA